MIRTVIYLLLIAALLNDAGAMVNLTAQKTYGGQESNIMPLFSLGIMHRSAFDRQYFEAGAMVKPVREEAIIGTYGGYYYTIWPIFRPGILLGIAFRKQEKWSTGLYYGLSVQAGIFTFVATGEGIGGGLNIPLRF